MKKLDLHIHTYSTYERKIEFSLDKLKKYVIDKKLDAIAITNHNIFNKEQFLTISKELDKISVMVFPGIEVTLEHGHILVIAPIDCLEQFDAQCNLLGEQYVKNGDYNFSVNLKEFKKIYDNLADYLLIPHTIDKNKPISQEVIMELSSHIFIGEVGNAKKFESVKKNNTKLIPVLFSDLRADENLESFPNKATYLDLNNIEDLKSLKISMHDRSRIFVNSSKIEDDFEIIYPDFNASSKLNLILGKRSSGKTTMLENIMKSFENRDIKYIKQFSLVGVSEKESFDNQRKKENDDAIEDYLTALRDLIRKIIDIDTLENNKKINGYLKSLKQNAESNAQKDAYSSMKLFDENLFTIQSNNELGEVVKAIETLVKTENYKQEIKKYIDSDKLFKLFEYFIKLYRQDYLNISLTKKVNTCIKEIKSKLSSQSSNTPIKSIDLCTLYKQDKIVKEFNKLSQLIKGDQEFFNESEQRFKIIGEKRKFKNATELKKNIGIQVSCTEEFNKLYNVDMFSFLRTLVNNGKIAQSEIYKCIINFEFKVLNQLKNNISGGERAEFNLIRQLREAENYDLLLIDEPEASFDNLYIKDHIKNRIKNLSSKTTVFLTTHNNTLGTVIKPNKIFYTENDENNNFKIYCGDIADTCLKTVTGDEIENYSLLMDIIEAGEDTYKERGELYASIKSK
jgi:ABC-type lipoprotein export system ATPase subunit